MDRNQHLKAHIEETPNAGKVLETPKSSERHQARVRLDNIKDAYNSTNEVYHFDEVQ